MYSPIFMCGRFTTQLSNIDNDQINEDVLLRKNMKLDDTVGNTFTEDSYYPETEACDKLIKEVDHSYNNYEPTKASRLITTYVQELLSN